jgi:hypothetical protein
MNLTKQKEQTHGMAESEGAGIQYGMFVSTVAL